MPLSRKEIGFDQLTGAGLSVDALYRGGSAGNAGDDPLCKLLPCGNQGGFRVTGSTAGKIKMCALYTDLAQADWPDSLDSHTGLFTYYGDNRHPGHGLHDKTGNRLLRNTFGALHSSN